MTRNLKGRWKPVLLSVSLSFYPSILCGFTFESLVSNLHSLYAGSEPAFQTGADPILILDPDLNPGLKLASFSLMF
jgi:hypothetical protein